MQASENRDFYSNLPLNSIPISDLIADKSLFANVPDHWHVLAADIKNSTQAIQDGKHHDVNLIATGCIIAILNLTLDSKYTVPFFFGGDGAVLLVPPSLLESGLDALEKLRKNTYKNFGLVLKTGHLPVKEIYENGIELKIAKSKISNNLVIPVVLGDGLHYAENIIKDSQEPIKEIENTPLNLNGMECKWDKVKPPRDNQEVVSLLVTGGKDQDHFRIFSEVLKAIDNIYGAPQNRKPISVEKLQLKSSLRKIKSEMKAKLGKFNFSYLVKNWFRLAFGEYYLKNTVSGKDYLQKLVELTDNLSIDGRINTVITGTPKQRIALIKYLDKMEEKGKLGYGIHISKESVISCYVRDISTDEHIHFVDGSNGGYTKAANMLKEKTGILTA